MADQSCSSLSQSNRQAVTRSARIIFIPDPRLSRAVIEHNEEDSYLYEMTCWIDPQVLSRIEVAAPHCVRSEDTREVDLGTGEVSASLWEWVCSNVASELIEVLTFLDRRHTFLKPC